MKKLLLIIVFGQYQIGLDIDGEVDEDRSGQSVFLSSDGNTVAIGAPDGGEGEGEEEVTL